MNQAWTSEPGDLAEPISAAGRDSHSSHSQQPIRATASSRVSAPINLHPHGSSDTCRAHPGHRACAAHPHMHAQCFARWPFFLAGQMATWQLQQMPHQPSRCAEAVAFYFPLPPVFFFFFLSLLHPSLGLCSI